MPSNIVELSAEIPVSQQANLFGQFDEHLKKIEKHYLY